MSAAAGAGIKSDTGVFPPGVVLVLNSKQTDEDYSDLLPKSPHTYSNESIVKYAQSREEAKEEVKRFAEEAERVWKENRTKMGLFDLLPEAKKAIGEATEKLRTAGMYMGSKGDLRSLSETTKAKIIQKYYKKQWKD